MADLSTPNTIGAHNGSTRPERRRQQKTLDKMNAEIDKQIADVEQAIDTSSGEQREHYRALLRRLQQVRAMEPAQ